MKLDVQVYPYDGKNGLKGFATVKVADCLVIKDFTIRETKGKLWVSMPSRKDTNGEFYDTVFPVTKEFRNELIDCILDVYELEVSEQKKETTKPSRNRR